jgi:dolichol-phosphate mannosyltransferase
MWSLIHLAGVHYVPAAVIATEVAIVHNFLMQERFVFRDLRNGRHRAPVRFVQSLLYNNIDTAARIPLLILLVEQFSLPSTLAQAATLLLAFVARFCFVSLVVYGPARPSRRADTGLAAVNALPASAVGEEPRGT